MPRGQGQFGIPLVLRGLSIEDSIPDHSDSPVPAMNGSARVISSVACSSGSLRPALRPDWSVAKGLPLTQA